ncbi:hypothetical protein [Lysobacter gummosus]|uniref:hypothetical protein n=1 Tax=Lysobacter gummosus TaxID=262324 RepID=UPI00362ECC8F
MTAAIFAAGSRCFVSASDWERDLRGCRAARPFDRIDARDRLEDRSNRAAAIAQGRRR